ncbi:MAG TPA: preprotein translocase subunit YajC [Longimicrobiales bacterium]|nr:preprotein translocase subunit YajC [Longimicrobiales bacterium]
MNMLAIVASPEGQTSLMPMIIMWTAIIAIFYFLLIRPQKKAQQRHQEMVAGLKRGDEVMTDGGIVGQVIHLKDDRVTLKTAGETRIEVARAKISRVFTAATPQQ